MIPIDKLFSMNLKIIETDELITEFENLLERKEERKKIDDKITSNKWSYIKYVNGIIDKIREELKRR